MKTDKSCASISYNICVCRFQEVSLKGMKGAGKDGLLPEELLAKKVQAMKEAMQAGRGVG